MSRACAVCGSLEGVYRCRTCNARYCSIECYKKHGCLEIIEPQAEPQKSCGIASHNQSRVHNSSCGALEVLQLPHLAALSSDAYIRNCLKSAELQSVLQTINSSRSRLDALEAAQHNIPEFRRFCEHVLRTVYSV